MKTTYRRIALLTGVSAAALGAAPAFAAPHDTATPNVYYPGGTATSDIAICDIAGTEPCFYGIVAEGSPAVTANVDTTTEGQIYQWALGTTNLVLSNTGSSAEVGAIAHVTGTPAAAVANATLASAIEQAAGFGSTVTVTLDNGAGGNLLIDASAQATGVTAATANARIVDFGFGQFVGTDLSGNAVINNDGNFTIEAIANASATSGAAIANASFTTGDGGFGAGIVQSVTGVTAANATINNDDSIAINAIANATGTSFASANAALDGIYQNAEATDGAAVATIDNDGSIAVLASANASAASGLALADAYVSYGISQNASGISATAGINNGAGASIDIGAIAQATGTAAASVTYGTWSGTAFNHGAVAQINEGIVQNAHATGTYTVDGDVFGGDAVAQVTNAGSIDIHATATANATLGDGGAAFASAAIRTGIDQFADADAGGDATASLSNSNTIDITALASANGTDVVGLGGDSWSGASYYPEPGAQAFVGVGVNQYATAVDGAALATVANDGALNVQASAFANAANTDTAVDGLALAGAYVGYGVNQDADGLSATANLDNGAAGIIDIGAVAAATGTDAATVTYAATIWGSAESHGVTARVGSGIRQIASASGTYTVDGDAFAGDAAASLGNDGTIDVHATATAKATASDGGLALASATVGDGVYQQANADGGNATATLGNTNAIDITAVANATGNDVVGIDGTAWFSWSGYYDTPGAQASIDAGIHQYANAYGEVTAYTTTGPGTVATGALYGDASVALTNDGTINIDASANADATGHAWASAYIGEGIHQRAYATGIQLGTGDTAVMVGGDAMVSLINNSPLSIDITAIANVTGATATASATVDSGINQTAIAMAGDASVVLDNPGAIAISALASANGTNYAEANADVDGIRQDAYAPLGVASNSLTNDGTIDVHASATANAASLTFATAGATVTANANAYATYGISQFADGGTSANNTLVNGADGVIDISAVASAVAPGITIAGTGTASNSHAVYPDANAYASLGVGINQYATADNFAQTTTTDLAGSPTTVVYTYAYAGSANAVNTLTNSGTVNVLADAFASAANASADANLGTGIAQYADANGGSAANATIALSNATDASINVTASASAVGQTNADAEALVEYGIDQDARANTAGTGNAAVSLTNDGAISVLATANASATGGAYIHGTPLAGYANAYATVVTGIAQNASVEANYLATRVVTTGVETTLGGTTTTTVDTFVGNGAASVALTNSGSIDIGANANADAGGANGDATAEALVVYGMVQNASVSAATGADASVDLANSGTIAINAGALATGSDWVYALASINEAGISQNAQATATDGPANAIASLTNSNSIDIGVNATANGDWADASAIIDEEAIFQNAYADGTAGTASAILTNSADIAIHASASANAATYTAYALASIATGISQAAQGVDAALVSMVNGTGGSIAISANANASGQSGGYAQAFIESGIHQNALANGDSGIATAALSNSGGISLAASAIAFAGDDGSASATATIDTAIYQFAQGSGAANVSLNNLGTIDVLLAASASADNDAYASAGIDTVVRQYANATGTGGDASATLTNTGGIDVAATATAVGGGDVTATAFIDMGILQQAYGGTTGSANVSLVNDGPLSMVANASALGGGDGYAGAFASAVSQVASAGGGASAVVTNNDVINVTAAANVLVGNAAHRGASATAEAWARGIDQNVTARTSDYTSSFTLTDGFTAGAVASDTLTGVNWTANQTFDYMATGPALASVNNVGSLSVLASASAVADNVAIASAGVTAVSQYANGSSASVSVDNGTAAAITAGATAFASGQNGASATAYANGIWQRARAVSTQNAYEQHGTATLHLTGTGTTETTTIQGSLTTVATNVYTYTPAGPATAMVDNSGVIDVFAFATAIAAQGGPAVGATSTTPAYAGGVATGIYQSARGSDALVEVDNSGSLTVDAAGFASGATAASAGAYAGGILQQANAVGSEFTYNYALGTVTGTTSNGHATTYTTLLLTDSAFESTNVGPANAVVLNTGSIDVAATATGVAGTAATAWASATGIYQGVSGATASASVSNTADASIDVAANASASGTFASASANALGIGQNAAGDAGLASVVNEGVLNVDAAAVAIGTGTAWGIASATGVRATVSGVDLAFENSGELNVNALATVSATTGTASAYAGGYIASGTGDSLNATITNTEAAVINVSATAVGPALASAVAQGISLDQTPTLGTGTDTGVYANPVSGTIVNDGALNVVAMASAYNSYTTTTTGGTTTTVYSGVSSARATGIAVNGGVNTMTITNTGSINVDAITMHGGDATAYGIRATSNGGATPLATDVLTINNSGDIIVRVSSDGGTTFHRGMAIDVASAANNTVVNLLGGDIYGNIDVQAGDAINVTTGQTVFNGIINPEHMPVGGLTEADLDSGLSGEGDLTISDGGDFYMVIDPVDGPSYAFVDTFTVETDGTLTLDLPPAVGEAPVGTYPQIFADVVTLNGGTLVANISAPSGLYDTTYYDNVIDGNSLTGTFDECIANGIPLDSALLDFGCIYPPEAGVGNVDLGLIRTAFNALGGLTANQLAVSTGIENAYTVDLTGDYADLMAELFLLDDTEIRDAYDMLSGVEYPNYLHAVRNNSFALNSVVSDQIDCPTTLGSVAACATPTYRGRVWVSGAYNTANLDSNANAIGYDADNWSVLVGGDYNFGLASLGAFAGYRNIKVDYPDAIVGSGIDSDGFQLGLYGGVDTGRFYFRAIGSYSSLNGDSERRISIGSLNLTAKGQPDLDVWSFYGEAGARFDLGNSWVTPYVALDYTSLHLKDFTESGGLGANLQFDAQTASQTSGLIGLKWAGNLGGITPEAKIAYRHDFENDLGVETRFAGISASTFKKVEDYDEDSIIAGLNFTGHLGTNFTGRLGYQGRFNSEVSDHTLYGTLTYLFGAAPPPPPPPPVEAPPPPPAPPATQVCPDGTTILATESCPVPPPPPPPPPPAPERG